MTSASCPHPHDPQLVEHSLCVRKFSRNFVKAQGGGRVTLLNVTN
jgi:hypothetical protein